MASSIATERAPAPTPAPPAPPAPDGAGALAELTPAQLAGQRVVFALDGTEPSPALERRIRRGEAGAVILFSRNLPSVAAARRLTTRLQAIARPPALDQPLLVMVDQEGGPVRRLAGAPARSAARLGQEPPASARAAGRAAGRLLRGAGVNVNLAPVADVARPGSALAGEGRIYSGRPLAVARRAVAFAAGTESAGVAATAKHFPGFGAASANTDDRPVTIALSAAALRGVDGRPYRALVAHDVALVMLSTAIYPALDPRRRPAALSAPIVAGELRERLGFDGVTITDALDTPALAGYGGDARVAVRAAGAGSDLLIYANTAAAGERAADGLTRALRTGELARGPAEAAVARGLALRERLADGPPAPAGSVPRAPAPDPR